MFAYLAVVWDQTSPAQSELARTMLEQIQQPRWRAVFNVPGLTVWCKDGRCGSTETYHLSDGHGLVVGTLFVRGNGSTTKAPLLFSPAETAAIIASGGRRLVRNYWGRYVAFLHDSVAAASRVLRDPSASLPCLQRVYRGVTVYACFLEDCKRLVPHSWSVHWPYIAASICHQGGLYSRETGVREVTRVLGGECITHAAGETTSQFYWDPYDIAESEVIDDPTVAEESLRQSTHEVVHAWASCYDKLLHALSGGLDSSIVLACLMAAPAAPAVTSFIGFLPAARSALEDERDYARKMAAGANCTLLEVPHQLPVNLQAILRFPLRPAPGCDFHMLEWGPREAALAAEHSAAAISYGAGGDQLYYNMEGRWAACDYAARHGLRPSLASVALDSALLDRESIWQVAGSVLREMIIGGTWDPASDVGRYRGAVRPELIEHVRRAPRHVHPLIRDSGRVPIGKRKQIYALLVLPFEYARSRVSEDSPDQVAPLMSQPLIETCLRIPTYLLTSRGWDRVLARRAFRGELPPEIISRRSKGGVDEYVVSLCLSNMNFLRPLLLDGALVREGFLDRTRLSQRLDGSASDGLPGWGEILDYAFIEGWLMQWDAFA
jgi:asparagine synthase (glutamine-hydrolysing)